MNKTIRVGIIGDYDFGIPSLVATEASLNHAAAAQSIQLNASWIPTASLATDSFKEILTSFHALWCAPGSPYQDMDGALRSIRFAREQGWPFIGT